MRSHSVKLCGGGWWVGGECGFINMPKLCIVPWVKPYYIGGTNWFRFHAKFPKLHLVDYFKTLKQIKVNEWKINLEYWTDQWRNNLITILKLRIGKWRQLYWYIAQIIYLVLCDFFAFFIQSREMNELNGENFAIFASGWLCMKNGPVCLLSIRQHNWGWFEIFNFKTILRLNYAVRFKIWVKHY